MKRAKREPAQREEIVPWIDPASTKDKSHLPRVSLSLDTEAAYNATNAYIERGGRQGRTIYNYPPELGTPLEKRVLKIRRPLGPNVRLIRAGRPALQEDRSGSRRRRKLGYTELEKPLHDEWQPIFHTCFRDVIILAPKFAERLPVAYRNRSHVEVSQLQGSPYKHLAGRGRMPREPRTAVFLLNVTNFFRGASLTTFFGPCGLSTLICSLMLRERHSDWLMQPGLRMVELIGTKIPRRYEDLGFTDTWRAETLLHVRL